MILRAGLTGGIASGKSTVAHALAESGLPVLDADRIVHALYEPGAEGTIRVREAFGPSVLTASGAVDRKALAAAVFGDPEKVRTLNALIHPLVHARQRDWFEELSRSGQSVGVIEATLLLESGGRARFDVIIVVTAPEEERIERALVRSPGMTRDEIRARIRAQWPDKKREELADIVIRNDGDRAGLIEQARLLALSLRERAAGRSQTA